LPTEITSEIFMHCLPCSLFEASSLQPSRAPMLLLHVCRSWRSLAISTPGLWVELCLLLRPLPKTLFDPETLDQLLSDWLECAGARPLSLILKGFTEGEEGRRLISTALNRLATRIQTLHLAINIDDFPDSEQIPGFPLLRNLQLSFPFNQPTELSARENPIQIFNAASGLRGIHLYLQTSPTLLAIPWEQLTEFTGE
ncbi:hypothetical protein DFH07DRAFT_697542, partial [Mycena maculata]